MAIRPLYSITCHFLAAFALLLPSACSGQEWSTLSGRIVVTGRVPQPATLDITRDEEVCGMFGLTDASLIVNQKNNGLQNVVIWLSSKKTVPVHPDLSTPPKPARLDNKDCTFQPRIVKLRTGQILQSTNADPVAHNVAVYGRRNTPFSIVVPQDQPLERSFGREELQPIRVDCAIHAWMRSYLIITEHPYSAVTDADGKFTIPKLPAGDWEFRFWHERLGYLKNIKLEGQPRELKRGVVERKITSTDQNMGELHISADLLASE